MTEEKKKQLPFDQAANVLAKLIKQIQCSDYRDHQDHNHSITEHPSYKEAISILAAMQGETL